MLSRKKYTFYKYCLIIVISAFSLFYVYLFFSNLPVYILYSLNKGGRVSVSSMEVEETSLLVLDSTGNTLTEYNFQTEQSFRIINDRFALTDVYKIESFLRNNNNIYALKSKKSLEKYKNTLTLEVYSEKQIIHYYELSGCYNYSQLQIIGVSNEYIDLIFNKEKCAEICRYYFETKELKILENFDSIYYSVSVSKNLAIITLSNSNVYLYDDELKTLFETNYFKKNHISVYRTVYENDAYYFYDPVKRNIYFQTNNSTPKLLCSVPRSLSYDFKNFCIRQGQLIFYNHAYESAAFYKISINQSEQIIPIDPNYIYRKSFVKNIIIISVSFIILIVFLIFFKKNIYKYSFPILIKQFLIFSPLMFLVFFGLLALFIVEYRDHLIIDRVSELRILSKVVMNNKNNLYRGVEKNILNSYFEKISSSFEEDLPISMVLYKQEDGDYLYVVSDKNEYPINTVITPEINNRSNQFTEIDSNNLVYYKKVNLSENYTALLVIKTGLDSVIKSYKSVYYVSIIIFSMMYIMYFMYIYIYNGILANFIKKLITNIQLEKNNELLIESADYEIGLLSQRALEFNKHLANYKSEYSMKINAQEEKIHFLNSAMERELDTARTIQNTIIPSDFSDFHSLNIASAYIPMTSLGGDFFDVIRISHTKTAAVIADVSGHGIGASLVTAMAKMLFTHASKKYRTTGQAVNSVNQRLTKTLGKTGIYMTAFLCVINTEESTLEYTNAGHFDIFVLKKSLNDFIPISSSNTIIGMFKNEIYTTNRIKIENGDKIFMYTDGITEARNKQRKQYGQERLRLMLRNNIFSNPQKIVDEVIEDVNNFTEGMEPDDDRALLCIEIKKEKY